MAAHDDGKANQCCQGRQQRLTADKGCGVTILASWLHQVGPPAGWTNLGRATTPPNKELKLTKPSIMELRSLTPVVLRTSWR
jgi:hypothetical protein